MIVVVTFIVCTALLGLYHSWSLNSGKTHDYYSDPYEGPYGACRSGCVKCQKIEEAKLTPLEKLL
jgi:hypothetical protein